MIYDFPLTIACKIETDRLFFFFSIYLCLLSPRAKHAIKSTKKASRLEGGGSYRVRESLEAPKARRKNKITGHTASLGRINREKG